jgi:Ca-activated chloride channel family protein
VRNALATLTVGGHTAIGDAITQATKVLNGEKTLTGRRVPSAIVLLSDGFSDLGSDPVAAARQAGSQHIPVYTVALGTDHGTIKVKHPTHTNTVPVPLAPTQLQQIARASGGKSYTVKDAGDLNAVYTHLAQQFGHKQVQHAMTSSIAGVGLLLLLVAAGLSLLWFSRLT